MPFFCFITRGWVCHHYVLRHDPDYPSHFMMLLHENLRALPKSLYTANYAKKYTEKSVSQHPVTPDKKVAATRVQLQSEYRRGYEMSALLGIVKQPISYTNGKELRKYFFSNNSYVSRISCRWATLCDLSARWLQELEWFPKLLVIFSYSGSLLCL